MTNDIILCLTTIIEQYRIRVSKLHSYIRVLLLLLLLTWSSCAFMLITGKIPLLELVIKEPNFGSVYPTLESSME